jgi:hypothetical protein
MIDPGHKQLSIVRQCELVSISRASFYRRPASESPENLALMRLIDEAFLEMPWRIMDLGLIARSQGALLPIAREYSQRGATP